MFNKRKIKSIEFWNNYTRLLNHCITHHQPLYQGHNSHHDLNKISNIDMPKDDMVQLEEQPIRRSHEKDLEQRLNRELLIINRDRA